MKKLINSLMMLILTLILFATTMYAWFTVNEKVETNAIEIQSNSFDCDVKIFRNINNTWSDFSTIGKMSPGETIYFKLVIQSKSDTEITVSAGLRNITSILTEELYVNNGSVCVFDILAENFELYKLNENNEVIVDSKILYKYTDKLEIVDYKIQDYISFYLTDSSFAKLSNNFDLNANLITNEKIIENGTLNCYFALHFDENATSLVSYQKLLIKSINVKVGQ